MIEDQRGQTLRRFFAGLTEYAFAAKLGVADPPLIDYISQLLARFVHADDIYALHTLHGKRLTQVVDMLAEAERRQGQAKRQVHRHIGDFTLFWAGLYPEMVQSKLRSQGKDQLIDYQHQGKQAYWIASTIPVEKEAAPADVLQRLSDQFDLCVLGLNEVRKQLEAKPQ